MGTKMKGLLKGLRYISQIFDEEKEAEMQIGFPTDVKHVAHIGWDGPSVDSPSWMKEFKAPHGFQSAPLSLNGESKENREIKWVSEELTKSSRRRSGECGSSTSESTSREPSTKSRQSRRNTPDGSKPGRQPKDPGGGPDSSASSLPDIPKKSRRKKSKESVSGGSSRSKAKAAIDYTSPYSDPGPDTEPVSGPIVGELSHTSSLKAIVKEGDRGCNGIS